VTEIGAGAFDGCLSLTSIKIPEKIAEIRVRTFAACRSLTNITIPKQVTDIAGAFVDCSSLTGVTFEKGSQLKSLHSTFLGCTALTSIKIPASVEIMENSVFEGCSSLTSVTFEEKSHLKFIKGTINGYYYAAFKDCIALTSIEIPASVETMQGPVFLNCSSLTNVTFEKGSLLKSMIGEIYWFCPALTSIEIPASIKKITSIVDDCNNLTYIYCHPIVPPEITNWDCKNFVLYVPSQSIEAYKNSSWSKYYSSIEPIE